MSHTHNYVKVYMWQSQVELSIIEIAQENTFVFNSISSPSDML